MSLKRLVQKSINNVQGGSSMEVLKIEEEISQLENRIELLKKQVNEIQETCKHHFKGNQYYETCTKCNKVNVLYY